MKLRKRRIPNLSFRVTIIKPDREIDDAIDNRDWVSAFATAVSYFEYHGASITRALMFQGETTQL